jgi:mono/diheme cytochrome c family protein
MKNVFVFLLLFMMIAGYALADEKKAVTYEKDVKKIVSAGCLSCHGSDSPAIGEFMKDKEGFKQKMKGPRMDTYENLIIFISGKDAGALMRRLDDGKNTKDGNPGNMFEHLGKTDPERAMNLEIIKKWIGGWTLKRKTEMTESDLKAIKAREK